jgi:hexosaminidase
LIDAFAALKLNRLHLHLTDDQGWRIESQRYPALHGTGSRRPQTRLSSRRDDPVYDGTPHGGYYTLADLAEINAYAAQRMITVVPEIEVPGHASALLAACPELGAGPPPPGGYQVLADWGIFPYLMSPLRRTRDFLRDVLGELLEAVPAPYVHIGGDECVLDAWRDDAEVDAYRRRRGLAGLRSSTPRSCARWPTCWLTTSGPARWCGTRGSQEGGTGARRHRPGAVTVHLDQLASGGS